MRTLNVRPLARRFCLAAGILIAYGWLATAARAADLFVSDPFGNAVRRYSSTGADLGIFASAGLNYPEGLAFDASGNLYVANGAFNDGSVRKFSPTGVDLGIVAPIRPGAAGGGVAIDSSGNIYVTALSEIHKFSPAGADLGIFASPGLFRLSVALVFDQQGNLYASAPTANILGNVVPGNIRKFGPDGTDLGTIEVTGMDYPSGLAFDSAGALYAANLNSPYMVRQFSVAGADLGAFATAGFSSPMGLALDDGGNLYVGSFNPGFAIHKFDPSGADLGEFGTAGLGYQAGYMAFAATPVPEPSGAVLLALGTIGLLLSTMAIRRSQSL